MDHPFSIDEVPRDSLWTLQQPIPQVPGGDSGGVAAAGVSEDTTTATAGPQDDAATDRSLTEWGFERLLEEELLGNTTPPAADSSSEPVVHDEEEPAAPDDAALEVEPAAAVMADPIEYNAMLKQKLEEDLATIAMWRASGTVHQENSQDSSAYNGGNQNLAQDKFRDGGEHLAQNSCAYARLPARSSSVDPSPTDDDDMRGEVGTSSGGTRRFRRPDAERLKKRKQSNRESARRSRTRKAAHLKDLEDQVTHLRVENSLLMKRLDSLHQRYNACAVDNRILRADMETLRTKVRMAEDTVNRLMGTNSLSFVGSPSRATLPAHPPPVLIQNHNVANTYYTAAAAAPNARANTSNGSGSYMPRAAAAPSPLQAAAGAAVNNGSSSTETAIQYRAAAAALSSTAAMELRLRERPASAVPSSSAAATAPANGLDQITDADMVACWDDPLIGVSMDDIWGNLN